MAFLAAAAPFIGLATTAVSAYQQYEGGKAAAANQQLAAIQQEQEANQAQVEAQRVAINERRRAKLVRSRALAVAGKSGTDPSDVDNILMDIEEQGEMNALNSLWSGDYAARGLRQGAAASRREGSAIRTAATANALATGIQGATSFAGSYGGFKGSGTSRVKPKTDYGTALSDFANKNPSFFEKYGDGALA